ncbi:hypothetical protein ACIBHX_14225 [Nonomuraea sp. NPDC050536]|uniref:hypothetical protein n=1 Tax=Nonomuraea sp. NPDC050536 TaxID=3364366 RepID=UPI0037C7950B
MSVQTSAYATDTLPADTVDVVVIGGGAAGLNGALMLGRRDRQWHHPERACRGHARLHRARARFAARDIGIIDTPAQEVVDSQDGASAGVRLADGTLVPRRVLAVVAGMQARTEGMDGLKLPTEELPGNMGRRFASGMAGTTDVPGVWVAGNATDLTAQVGASTAAGALAGSYINALLATADTDVAEGVPATS